MDFSKLGLTTEQLKKLAEQINQALTGNSGDNSEVFSTVYFTNITKEDFSHPFNSKMHTVKAGQTLALPSHLAEHLAHHLISKILAEKYADTIKSPKVGAGNIDIRVHPERAELYSKIVSDPVVTANSEIELAIKTANLKQEIAEIKDQHLEADEDVEEEDEEAPEPIKTFVAKKKVVKKAVKNSKKSEDMEAFDETVA